MVGPPVLPEGCFVGFAVLSQETEQTCQRTWNATRTNPAALWTCPWAALECKGNALVISLFLHREGGLQGLNQHPERGERNVHPWGIYP